MRSLPMGMAMALGLVIGASAAIADTSSLSTEAIADSANAAARLRDWPRAVRFGELLVTRVPNNASLLMTLGNAVQNCAFVGDTATGAAPNRTSLGRIAFVKRAFALFDAAIASAASPAERAEAMYRRASLYNVLGFHAEAAAQYQEVLRYDPHHVMSRLRVEYFVQNLRGTPGVPTDEAP